MARLVWAGLVGSLLLLSACNAGVGFGSASDDLPPAGPVEPAPLAAADSPTPCPPFPAPSPDDRSARPSGDMPAAPAAAPGAATRPAAPPAPAAGEVVNAAPSQPPSACCVEAAPCCTAGQLYVGLGGHVLPGFGGQATLGYVFASNARVDWAAEFSFGYDDLTHWFNDEGATGKFRHYTAGLRVRSDPCGCGHWVGRAGFAFMDVTGRPQDIDFDPVVDLPVPADYVGAYASIAYEWEVGNNLSHGPELRVFGGWGDGEFGYTPMLMWNFFVHK